MYDVRLIDETPPTRGLKLGNLDEGYWEVRWRPRPREPTPALSPAQLTYTLTQEKEGQTDALYRSAHSTSEIMWIRAQQRTTEAPHLRAPRRSCLCRRSTSTTQTPTAATHTRETCLPVLLSITSRANASRLRDSRGRLTGVVECNMCEVVSVCRQCLPVPAFPAHF